MRRQLALAIVVAFVGGSLMTGTMASADTDTFSVDSFFDVFYEFTFNPDRCEASEFPKVTGDLSDTKCVPKSDFQVDSFFDVFYEIDTSLRTVQTEMLSLQLTSTDPATGAIPDSFFDVWTEISVHNEDVADLQRQLDGHVTVLKAKDDGHDKDIARIDTEILSMDLRVSDLEDNPPQASTTAAFIKIGDIEGESDESPHKEWSNLLSFDQGQSVSSPSTESRRLADVTLGDVVVVKWVDKASPKIAEAVLTGEVFPEVEIELTASFGEAERLVYYAYELTNVRVTSYNISGPGQGDDVPLEEFSLNFEEIKVTYTEYDSDGNSKGDVEYIWNIEEGQS